jgi:Pyruvate/2-oxoacid:ferredoxin oxidoreductase gamma subunit
MPIIYQPMKLLIELGNFRVANMVMLGAYLEKTQAVSLDSIMNL